MSVNMNNFTMCLKNAIDDIKATDTLGGLVLSVQRAFVNAGLEHTEEAYKLVSKMLNSGSYQKALDLVYAYMS
jgi:hypothetical protein